jgi:hypothetical protein
MQNEKCKMKNVMPSSGILHSAFCILYFAFFMLLASLCSTHDAFASETARQAVPLHGERFAAPLTAVTADGLAQFAPNRPLPMVDVVRWGHPVKPRPQPLVVLDDGSRIVAAAAWASAAPVTLAGDELIVKSDVVNDVRVSRGNVRGIVYAERNHPDERRDLEESIRPASKDTRLQDELLLTNDDRLKGRVTEIAAGTLTVATESGDTKLPLSRIQMVTFANPQPARSAGSQTLVALRDGALLRAQSLRADDKSLEIQLARSGAMLTGGSVSDIVALQSLGGPALAYLSDLEPSGYRHVPYLSIEWPYERDRNVRGGSLVVGGNRFVKGLGMHSAARLTYALDPTAGWRRFDASVAVDDSARGRGSVTFGVHVLRGSRWQTAHTSDIIRGGQTPVDLSVDVSGATGLTLTVDYADRGDELDHADWLDARLVK